MLNTNDRNETVTLLLNRNENFILIQPTSTMPQKRLSVLEKLKAIEEAAGTGNVRQTARKWNFYPSTVRKWRKNYEKIKEMAEKSPRKLSLTLGLRTKMLNLEILFTTRLSSIVNLN